MRLAVTTNVDQVFRDMDAFVARAQQVAIPRALNKLRDQAQVAGLRKINDLYQIGPRTSEKYLRIKLAGQADLEAAMSMVGSGFPLALFSPIKTPRGVSVKIKGKRFLISHAFQVQQFGSNVFARGAYAGKGRGLRPSGKHFGRFQFGIGRLPINKLYTFSPADMLANQEVVGAMQDRIEEQVDKVIASEMRRVGVK